MFGRRKYLVVTGSDHDGGFRENWRNEMFEHMSRGGLHGNPRSNTEEAYKDGYRQGWEDAERNIQY
ncbi:MAG: hypothetical protein IJ588_12480 [Prevotella sp.]|nr:hypothetical protein [Prevotella sp.]